MIKKLAGIEINPDTPFENDALQRQREIGVLTHLVQSTRQPFVLSVEAPWGFGKTTFIRLWKAHLESQKNVCLYFNAWENDFVDDPLVAFLGEMRKTVEEKTKGENENDPINKNWESVKRIGGGVLRKTLPLAIQIATHGLLNQEAVKKAVDGVAEEADKIGEFASTLAKERLEKYEAEKEGIKGFRKNLEGLASEITKKTGNKPPLIFFVDELDRCRPDFAVALLERIKHLFNVPNVVFVLAIDRGQINQSVKAMYGVESKPDGYLRRFIDLSYQLLEPSGDAFALNLYNRFAFHEYNWQSGQLEAFLKSFAEFARVFGLSLRAQEQCFTEINIAMRTNLMIRQFPVVITFLATLRASKPGIVEELRKGQMEIEDVMEQISSIKHEIILFWAEATMRIEFQNGKNAKMKLGEIQRWNAVGPIPSGKEETVRRAQRVYGCMQALQEWTHDAVSRILSFLEMSARFS
ncbi:MAG: P-loop NTPase fold protein [Verrucomicrobia bacterium]|nr:P-loop NTPase fold protein [Verrucomicrobiota bacterium]